MLDVHKPCFLEVLSPEHGGVRIRAKLCKRLEEVLGEALDRPIFGDTVVVGVNVAVNILEFNPCTGLYVT